MMRLNNNNKPFSDNLNPTNKIKVYAAIASELNFRKKGTENSYKVRINLGEPI